MVALTIMSMVDRLILALLVKPLRADLHLTDVQLGLLFGTAFAIFYGALGLPLARVADRSNRVRLVTIGVILWSVCTILSGLATSFGQLLALRAGLALGEAALFPSVHSLIHDMFDARRRPLAASIIMTAPPIGGAIAFMAGGGLVGVLGHWVADGGGGGFRAWQLVFFAVGLLSLLLGLLFGLAVREPARQARLAGAPPAGASAALLGRRMMMLWLILAGGVCQIVPYAYQAWAPTLLTDKYGLSIGIAGLAIGISSAAGSIAGSLLLPLLALRKYDRGRATALATVPLTAVLVGTTVYGLAPLQDMVGIVLAAVAVGNFALLGSNAVIIVAMQRLAPDNLRATIVAGTLLVSSSLGLGVGPVMVAYIANRIGTPPRFDIAMALLAVAAGALAIGLFILAWRRLSRTMWLADGLRAEKPA